MDTSHKIALAIWVAAMLYLASALLPNVQNLVNAQRTVMDNVTKLHDSML